MRFAETGCNRGIDLAAGNIEPVQTDPGHPGLHLGGLETSVKVHRDGVPTREALVDLRLPEVAEELGKRGILKPDEAREGAVA